jgi:hypothetical protein
MRIAVALSALVALVACESTSGSAELAPKAQTENEKACSRAYTGLQGARSKFEQSLTEAQKASLSAMPDKARFVEACKVLEPATSKCLDPNWLQVNAQECEELLSKVPKETMEALAATTVPEAADEPAAEGEAPAEGEAAPAAGDLVKQAMEKGQ